MQDLESTQLMVDMLERPKAFWGHCQRYAGSLIMQVAFNKRANRNTDPAVADMVSYAAFAGIEDYRHTDGTSINSEHFLKSLPLLLYLAVTS